MLEGLWARDSQGAMRAALAKATAQAAVSFASSGSACGASIFALALAKGALHMITPKIKILLALVVAVMLLTTGSMLVSPPALGDGPDAVVLRDRKDGPILQAADKPAPGPKGKPQPSVILLWMSCVPSQIDTWDPNPGKQHGGRL